MSDVLKIAAIIATIIICAALLDRKEGKAGRKLLGIVFIFSLAVYFSGLFLRHFIFARDAEFLSLIASIPLLWCVATFSFRFSKDKYKNLGVALASSVATLFVALYGLVFGLLNTFGE